MEKNSQFNKSIIFIRPQNISLKLVEKEWGYYKIQLWHGNKIFQKSFKTRTGVLKLQQAFAGDKWHL